MSDCFTNAMKPKEPPEGMCSCNKSRGYDELKKQLDASFRTVNELNGEIDTLEQRCQQLEQVAKRLWNFVANRAPKIPQSSYILGKTADQLEALGVSLDD